MPEHGSINEWQLIKVLGEQIVVRDIESKILFFFVIDVYIIDLLLLLVYLFTCILFLEFI